MTRNRVTRRSLMVAATSLVTAAPARATAGRVLVAAASDLQRVMPALISAFQSQSKHAIVASYGSTGNFSRQIRQGAPFQLFLAADEAFVHDLARDGVIAEAGPVYALGRLALIAHPNGDLSAGTFEALTTALAQGRSFRFAIANPDHAPYGQRALEVLAATSLRSAIEPRLVFGENVSQAYQMVASGAVAIGMASYSHALEPSQRLTVTAVPSDLHRPLVQRLALTRKATVGAEAFASFLVGAEARTIFKHHGFDLP